MSRLTIRSGMFDENGNRIQDLEGYHTSSSDANRFAKKEIYKLGQLEDVLEEFGIESAEELKKQLSKAIVPEYFNGDKAYAIIDTMAYRDVFTVKIVGVNLVYEVDDGYDGTTLQHSSRIFKTVAEAEKKLKELEDI